MKNLQDFPRIPLAVLPTPIQKLENISRLLNTNVYIKRRPDRYRSGRQQGA